MLQNLIYESLIMQGSNMYMYIYIFFLILYLLCNILYVIKLLNLNHNVHIIKCIKLSTRVL